MTSLTVEFKGVLEDILESMIKQGYVKTKAEALRVALLHYGKEMGIVKKRLHERVEDYIYEDFQRKR